MPGSAASMASARLKAETLLVHVNVAALRILHENWIADRVEDRVKEPPLGFELFGSSLGGGDALLRAAHAGLQPAVVPKRRSGQGIEPSPLRRHRRIARHRRLRVAWPTLSTSEGNRVGAGVRHRPKDQRRTTTTGRKSEQWSYCRGMRRRFRPSCSENDVRKRSRKGPARPGCALN